MCLYINEHDVRQLFNYSILNRVLKDILFSWPRYDEYTCMRLPNMNCFLYLNAVSILLLFPPPFFEKFKYYIHVHVYYLVLSFICNKFGFHRQSLLVL